MAGPELGIAPPRPPEVEADPSLGPAEPIATGEPIEAVEAVTVDEAMVRSLLVVAGDALSTTPLADVDVEDHWVFAERELDELVPPLTRYINRRPQLVRAVAHGDEAVMAFVLGKYLNRNVTAASAARKDRRERERQTGGAEDGAHAPAAGEAQVNGNGAFDGGRLPGAAGGRLP